MGEYMKTTIKKSYDVVIVGAGPCGVSAANVLGKQGISTLVLDKEADIVMSPRAVGICEEGSRIIDTIGILDDPEMEFKQIDKVRFRDKNENTAFFADTNTPKSGHSVLRTFHQPDLEKSLHKALNGYKHVDLATSTELLDFIDKGFAVELTLKQGEKEIEVKSRYLLACDGASSPIRKKLNIGFSGDTYPQDWMVVDVERNPEESNDAVFSIDPERPSVTLPGPGNKRRWEFVVKEGDNPEELFKEENLSKLLAPWGDVKDMQVSRKAVYTFHARTAEKYQLGNVFLLGDAAHITPPFAGQGLMAGLRDVHNLCWKLSAVLKKQLAPSILNSYQEERIPQSQQIIKFAQSIGGVILPQTIGKAKARDGVIKALGWVGLHSKDKGLPVEKVPNHINGGYFKHLTVSKIFKTGIEFPQHPLQKGDKPVLADKLIDEQFYLLGWNIDPEDFLTKKTLSRWHSMAGKKAIITEKNPDETNYDAPVFENKNQEYKKLFSSGKRVLVVRPDKMMVLNCSAKSLNEKLNKYMDTAGCTI